MYYQNNKKPEIWPGLRLIKIMIKMKLSASIKSQCGFQLSSDVYANEVLSLRGAIHPKLLDEWLFFFFFPISFSVHQGFGGRKRESIHWPLVLQENSILVSVLTW